MENIHTRNISLGGIKSKSGYKHQVEMSLILERRVYITEGRQQFALYVDLHHHTRVQRLVTEYMQVHTCASKYLPCVTEKGTCICSVTNRCTLVHVSPVTTPSLVSYIFTETLYYTSTIYFTRFITSYMASDLLN